MPVVLGHEGSGVVSRLGEGVTDLEVGDHVILSWVPQCGACRQCVSGRPWQCEVVANVVAPGGVLLDGTSRWGDGFHHYLGVSAFAERVVVPRSGAVKIRKRRAAGRGGDRRLRGGDRPGRRAQHGGGAAGRHGRRDRLRRRRAVGDPGRAAGAGLADRRLRPRPGQARGGAAASARPRPSRTPPSSATSTTCSTPSARSRPPRPAIGALALGGAAVIVGLPPTGQTARFDPLALAEANQRILGSNYGSIDPQHEIPLDRRPLQGRHARPRLADLRAAAAR